MTARPAPRAPAREADGRGPGPLPAILAALAVLVPVAAEGAVAAGIGGATAAVRSAAAVQEADTVTADTVTGDTLPAGPVAGPDTVPRPVQAVPDSLLPDSLRSVPDSLLPDSLVVDSAVADTAGPVSLSQRRGELAGGSFPSRDSLFDRLLEARGYRAVEYRARDVRLQVPRRLIRLQDSAQTNYGSSALRADTILYRGETRFVEARGRIELVGAQQEPVRSDSVLFYDVGRRKGTVYRARTRTTARGASWNVQGDAIPRGRRTLFVESGSFTSCTLRSPHYHFEAGQVKMVSQEVLVAWPVVLRIGNVPVAWLPFFAHSIRPDRASGILPPRFGFNDVVRTAPDMQRQVSDFGYYWAINEHMDARATMGWFSGDHTEVRGRFRYAFTKDFLDGSLAAGRSWGGGQVSTQFDWQHNQELSPNTTIRVSSQFVTNSQTFRERSFDPRDQLRRISSNVGFNHRLPWANLSVSASRRQSISGSGGVSMTLPSVNLNFSPVTLFPAPRSRAGTFNNLTWNGSVSASRSTQSQEMAADDLTRQVNARNSLRLDDFSLSASANVNNSVTTPVDSAGNPLPDDRFRTNLRWSSSLDYQVDLVGSTTFQPTASLEGQAFASDSTAGDVLAAPVRMNFGASLNTDLYGFFPGFGPFSRIRHKISPGVSWRYSPPVTPREDVEDIPGFPVASGGRAQNVLTLSLNQTFEAKIGGGDAGAAPGDTAGAATDTAAAASDTTADADGGGGGGQEGQKVTLLSLRTSSLTFDFQQAEDQPVLTTDEVQSSISSDLLRGLSFNLTHDLFAGSGEERSFDPVLTRVGTGFSFSSGQGLAEILGIGLPGTGDGGDSGSDGGGQGQPTTRSGPGQGAGGRDVGSRGSIFTESDPQMATGSGPWDVSVNYSLYRPRSTGEDGGGAGENQTLGGSLRFQPTPNWRVNWRTSYNVTTGEFGSHQLRLTRQLHRWEAEFSFSKAPNGNVRFDVMVRLTDAPEIQVPYQIQTRPGERRGAGRQ